MKIAFAIPTYNRVEKLQVLVNSILAQQYNPEETEVYCVISNSCSTDGTSEYLNNLRSDVVKFVIRNEIEYIDGIVKHVGYEKNIVYMAELIPDDIEWVWFLGDDDYLVNTNVLAELQLTISKQEHDIKLIHACQARRSCKSGEVYVGTLFDLCNNMGFHEMLGWISSLIVERNCFLSALLGDLHKNSTSAYAHSAALLEVCHGELALFIDSAWVEPQDEQQTQESIDRWQKENIAERYFGVVDDLTALYQEKILTRKCKPIFFRYLTYSFWDRYICFLIADAINTNQISDRAVEHWNRILNIADMLEDPAEAKLHRSCVKSVFNDVEDYIKQLNEVNQKKTKLIELHSYQAAAVYPFTNLEKEA